MPSGLLNMNLENKAKAIYSNCRQMISQYNKKRLDVEANVISAFYHPFEPFDGNKVNEIISFTEKLLEDEQYEKLMVLSEEIFQLSLNGLNYYHNYYQRPLLITVTLSFVGWIFCLLRVLLEQKIFTLAECHNYKLKERTLKVDILIQAICILVCTAFVFIIYGELYSCLISLNLI